MLPDLYLAKLLSILWTWSDNSAFVQGLQFIVESDESSAKQDADVNTSKIDDSPQVGADPPPPKIVTANKTKIHRSYRVGLGCL